MPKTDTPKTEASGWALDVSLSRLLLIAVQLLLVVVVVHLFRVEESRGFLEIAPLIFVGFLIHAVLPLRYRMPFFLVVSFAAFWLVLQTGALWLVGIGAVLIGLCHLPIAYWARVGLVLVVAGVLVGIRGEWLPSPDATLPTLVLPVLGAMFMFRLILYLYDIRHERQPATIWERLSYFFLLPNVCFPLFPVVDYQTFRRTYYDKEAHEIYQKGVLWIFRGVTHLLIYRLVYY